MRVRLLSLLLLLPSALISQFFDQQKEASILASLEPLVAGRDLLNARYQHLPEPETRLSHLAGPERWGRCLLPEGPLFSAECKDLIVAATFYPPADAALGRRLVLNWSGAPYPTPVAASVLSYFAGVPVESLSDTEIVALANATAILLGNLPTGRGSVVGLENLRLVLAAREGDFVGPPHSLKVTPESSFALSTWLLAEVGARAGIPPKLPALATVASKVRRGEEPEGLDQPGLSGLACLEWGRKGDPARIPQLLQLSVKGPSAPDRLAALYAALRLSGGIKGLRAYSDCPDCKEALERAERLY